MCSKNINRPEKEILNRSEKEIQRVVFIERQQMCIRTHVGRWGVVIFCLWPLVRFSEEQRCLVSCNADDMLPFPSRIFSYFFDVQYVRHGLINLGLLFHGQPPPPLGVCEGQD
jgi:hypothetical protein